MNAPGAWLAAVVLAAMAGAAAAATHTVTIEGMKFVPAALTVRQGDAVQWQNKDVVPHTATAPGRFDSKAIGPGQAWTWKVDGKGRVAYVCTYHPGMQAVLVVE